MGVAGRVSDIVAGSQAEQLGVQIGWRFCRIGGEVYDLALVNKYAALTQPFTVRFFTSVAAALPEVEEKQLENPIVTTTKILEPQVAEVETKQTACWWCAA